MLVGPSGVGKTVLLDSLLRRVRVATRRITGEEWIEAVTAGARGSAQESREIFVEPCLVVLDNIEDLAGKPRTQVHLAEAINRGSASVVLASNKDLGETSALLEALGPPLPEIVEIDRPSSQELSRFACFLSRRRPSPSTLRRVAGCHTPAEVQGVLCYARARRALLHTPGI